MTEAAVRSKRWWRNIVPTTPRALARIVHSADFKEGLAAVPEAAGLLAISQGFPLVARDDLDTVERASFLYDALYAFLQQSLP